MICVEDRRKMVAEVEAAHRAGARLAPACELVGIRARTIQRWKADSGLERGDGRFGEILVDLFSSELHVALNLSNL